MAGSKAHPQGVCLTCLSTTAETRSNGQQGKAFAGYLCDSRYVLVAYTGK